MITFAKERIIEFFWIAGHNTIRGNVIVGDLVRLAARQLLMGPELVVVISKTQFKEYFRLLEEQNNKSYTEAKSCRRVKALISEEQPNNRTAATE